MRDAPASVQNHQTPSRREGRSAPFLRLNLRIQKFEFVLDAALEAAPGFTILFGASGAGKTTLLDCVSGLATPESGRISVGERVLFDSSSAISLATAQRRTGYVFQTLALFPHMTVEQNVGYGLSHLSRSDRAHQVESILQAFKISHLTERKAREISGGESQRVALARTLVTNPEVLLLDEPLAALDAPTKGHIIGDLREWNRSHSIPILYVTHSREEVFALGERVVVLDAGRIVAEGTPHEVMTAPLQETVAQLIGFENVFDAVVAAVRPERGTMTCSIAGEGGPLVLETPVVRGGVRSEVRGGVGGGVGSAFRIGIRAGDILLATSPPVNLSARNVIPGRIESLEQRDVIVSAKVECGVEMEVHLTLAARDSLELAAGREVWLVIKTHSCHLMQS
jgi:molybdate transport system ATP-binding protein